MPVYFPALHYDKNCNRTLQYWLLKFLWGDLGSILRGRGGGGRRIHGVLSRETVFSQLANGSTRMLVSGIFKQLRTFRYFSWCFWANFLLQMKFMMSASAEIIFYWTWLIILVWENEPKWKETVNYLELRHHRLTEEYTRENVWKTNHMGLYYILSWSCQVWLLAPPFFPNVSTSW